MTHIDIQSIYLWSMFCVNISVGNRFDFASISLIRLGRTKSELPTGDRFDTMIVRHFVDRQRPKIIIGFAVSHCRRFTLSKNSADHALLAVKSV